MKITKELIEAFKHLSHDWWETETGLYCNTCKKYVNTEKDNT